MAQQRYDVGDLVRVSAQFFNLDGEAANPTSVAAAVKTPSGVTTAVDSITQDGLTYYFDLLLTEGSNTDPYWVRFEGTGAVTDASEQDLWVRPPNVVIPAP
jgi:hypothetical protein